MDPLDGKAFAARSGLDLDRGAAFFFADSGDLILASPPVVDPGAFRRFFAGNPLGQLECDQVAGRTICAPDKEGIRASRPDSPIAMRVRRVPASMRGDVEIFALPPASLPLPLEKPPSLLFAGLDLDDEGFSVRAWMDLALGGEGNLFMASKPSAKAVGRLRGATGTARLLLPLAALKRFAPDAPLLPGVSAHSVVDLLDGEVVLLTRGTSAYAGAVVVFVKDEGKARALLEQACGLVPDARWDAGTCRVELSGQQVKIAASVDKEALVVSFDDPGPDEGTPPAELAWHPDAREVLTGDWSLSAWGTSWDTLAALPPGTLESLAGVVPDELRQLLPVFEVFSYLGADIFEMAFAVGLRDDGLHILYRVTTMARAGDAAFAAALARRAAGDLDGYRAAMLALKDRPGLLGRQARLLGEPHAVVGLPSVALVGSLAAVAVPAFMKYTLKAKTVEAVHSIKRMHEGASAYFRAHGKYPVVSGTATSEPPGTCCTLDGGTCPADAKIWAASPWTELDFSFDEPRRFTLQYESDPTGVEFTARAMGDFDCDGVFSTYEMVGKVGSDQQPVGSQGIYKDKELE